MKYDSQTLIYVVKEIFKLPIDRKISVVNYEDIVKLIYALVNLIPEEEKKDILNQLKDMEDIKKIMEEK